MTQWEYETFPIRTTGDMRGQLNALGLHGWELAAVTPGYTYIFKRVLVPYEHVHVAEGQKTK